MHLNNSLVIVDEMHKWITRTHSTNAVYAEKYLNAYEKLKTAKRLIILTGTPVYDSIADIAYYANLLEKDSYPIDETQFRAQHTSINVGNSAFYGYFLESKIAYVGLSVFAPFTALCLPLDIAPIAFFASGATYPVLRSFLPIEKVALRSLNTDKMKNLAEKYISFYKQSFEESDDYPAQKVVHKSVAYNRAQIDLYLDYLDHNLAPEQLNIFLADIKPALNLAQIRARSVSLQTNLLLNQKTGREIGNLSFIDKKNIKTEPPKFLEILKTIDDSPGQVAIYSNYDAYGIRLMAEFLESHNHNDYIILSPDLPTESQIAAIDQYNTQKKRIILIHPEITEGISLKATEQLHILEPIINAALQGQIIGRTIRYQSHAALPKDRRKVKVYLWSSSLDYSFWNLSGTDADIASRQNWQNRYAEINPNSWTGGINSVDKNYFLKSESPDDRILRLETSLEGDRQAFETFLKAHSIETQAASNKN